MKILGALLLLVLLTATVSAKTRARYRVVELPLPPHANETHAVSINNGGDVLINAYGPNYAGLHESQRVYIYHKGRLIDLGGFGGFEFMAGRKINDARQVILTAYSRSSMAVTNLFYDGTLTPVPSPRGRSWFTHIVDIHGSGMMTGSACADSPSVPGAQVEGFVWMNGLYFFLPQHDGVPFWPSAMNKAGTIVGGSPATPWGSGAYGSSAWIYREGTYTQLGNRDLNPYAINDAGDIVGNMPTTNDRPAGASFRLHGFLYADGAFTDLGALPNAVNVWPTSINEKRQIVGKVGKSEDIFVDDQAPFLWEGGELTDINHLVPQKLYRILAAAQIDNRGVIAATVLRRRGEKVRAAILRPVHESDR